MGSESRISSFNLSQDDLRNCITHHCTLMVDHLEEMFPILRSFLFQFSPEKHASISYFRGLSNHMSILNRSISISFLNQRRALSHPSIGVSIVLVVWPLKMLLLHVGDL